MIYEFFRTMSGPYLNSAVDCYLAHQEILNLLIVLLGGIWIFCRRKIKNE